MMWVTATQDMDGGPSHAWGAEPCIGRWDHRMHEARGEVSAWHRVNAARRVLYMHVCTPPPPCLSACAGCP